MTYTDILEDDDDDNGIHRQQFANALSAWSWMQQRETSVAEAAIVFNTTPELVRQAVDDHEWMFLEYPGGVETTDPTKQYIGHEGE